MNVQITWNGSDITHSIAEYVREADICTGQGTLDMTVEAKTARGFSPWNTIIVYENGSKMGTYNIFSAEEQVPGGIYVVSCQDDSKRLTDYFIDEQYTITYPSTAKYWIQKFLGEAGVSYNFNVSGSGSELSENTTLGMTSSYDAVLQLLQMCGWYFYFDADNVCQIGKLNASSTPVRTFVGNEILEIGYVKNDKMLRNRAVVWGAGDPDTYSWVYADTSTTTPWNRPGNDYRTIVYANGLIKSFGIAASLANIILKEFSQTIPEKNLKVPGSYSEVVLGSTITGISNTLTISGIVSHFSVNLSSGGFTSTYILDKRCPRLFGYVNWNDWVYIGTMGTGVWRKWITQSTWYNYSTGITDLNIKDLSAYDGLLGAIGSPAAAWGRYGQVYDNANLYVRHTSMGAWSKYNPGSFTDYTASGGPVILSSGITAEALSIDRTYGVAGLITAAFTIPNPSGMPLPSGSANLFPASGNLSWVQGITVDRVPVYTQQIIITSGHPIIIPSGVSYPNPYDIAVIDMDTNWDGTNLISVYNAQKVMMEMGPTYSGHMPEFDYGTFICQPNGSSPTGIVSQPPPTSGIVVEQESSNINIMPYSHGYKLLSVPIGMQGGVILEDDMEYDGRAYGIQVYPVSGDKLYKYVFHVASGTSNWYTSHTYPLNDNGYYLPAPTAFYKIDENTFRGTSLGTDYLDYAEGNYAYSFLITINESTGYADFTEFKSEQISRYWSFNDYGPQTDIRYSGGRYAAAMGTTQHNYDGPVWLGVVDCLTGDVIYKNSEIYPTGTYIIFGYDSSHHMIFGAYKSDGIKGYLQGGGWNEDAVTLYMTSVEKHTGEVNTTTLSPTLPFPPGGWYQFSFITPAEEYYNYHEPGISLAYENINTGEGLGHYYWIGAYPISFGTPYPFYNYTNVYTYFVDAIIDSHGFTGDYTVYTDIWSDGDTYFVRESGDIPSWVQHNNPDPYAHTLYLGGDTMHFETINSTNTGDFGVFWRGAWEYGTTTAYGMEHDLVITNPWDAGDVIAELENFTGFGCDVEYGRQAWSVHPRLDDFDNSIYTSARAIPSGGYWITVGYDFGGNLKKILYPLLDNETQQWVDGTPVQDKMVQYVSGGNGKIWIRVPVNIVESGKQSLQSRYALLRHDPKILPSGLFTIICEDYSPMYVDTSKNIPTVFYHKPYLDDYPSSNMGRSYLNEPGSFKYLSPGGGTGSHDVRVFDLDNSAGMFPASGYSTSGFLNRYIGVAGGKKGLLMYSSDFDSYYPTIIMSGAFTHLEFTNNDPDPYMFVSSSGISTSGRFYQRDKESILWNDYSVTLPSGVITIIRADDRM